MDQLNLFENGEKIKQKTPRLPDLTGQRFGMIVVLHLAANGKPGRWWTVKCDCGKVKDIRSSHILAGYNRSCGCRRGGKYKHGGHSTREFAIWATMKARCRNKNSVSYANYGGRGISVCERWEKFANFISDMGPAPDGWSLDRIDSDGNYEPSNCRWSSRLDQARNTSRNTFITANGRTMTVSAWASELGISANTLSGRLSAGWNHDDVVNTEVVRRSKTDQSGYAKACKGPSLASQLEFSEVTPDLLGRSEDLSGKRFGSYLVMPMVCRHRGRIHWMIKCDCGTVSAHTLMRASSG